MSAGAPLFCDVALPVPIDKAFTYRLPESLRGCVECGCRVIAPFGARKLTGVVVALHSEAPPHETRDIVRVIDSTAALPGDLLRLGRWIAGYYCAPIGEVLKAMLPLGHEVRKTIVIELTAEGREAAAHFRHAAGADDPVVSVLHALHKRPLTEAYLKNRVPGAAAALRILLGKGWVQKVSGLAERDPLLARGGRLMIEAARAHSPAEGLTRSERKLLDLIRGDRRPHEVAALAIGRKDPSAAARKLAKLGLAKLYKLHSAAPGARPVRLEIELNPAQQAALRAITGSLDAGGHRTFLLHGVTGSGKTEVYLRAIEHALARGKSALLLVPEIALTPQTAAQFFALFGEQVAILHSAFAERERSEQWRRVREGKARVVVGTRSGVFAPLRDLGLVVVDEEQEGSYKQDETPRYHGRNVAIVRAQQAGATVVLGSATPSLESRHNVEAGKYTLLELKERVGGRPLPKVEIIDMRREYAETGRNDMFSRALIEAVNETLAAGGQAMILLNRRGYSMYVLCRSCGYRAECENCSVTLTYHRRRERLLCHYCDFSAPVPESCPQCGKEYIHFQGSGSEKLEEYLRETFPDARVARLDRDAVRGRDHYESVIQAFREGTFDILAGTQMIAKGHDIPAVTLVGVINADLGLTIPEFRAAERTFQLLTQAAGRAGRGSAPGRVLLQTIEPQHYAVQFAAAHGYEGFYKKEFHFRRMMHYPPFVAMATMVVRSEKMEEALEWSGKLGRRLQKLPPGIRMLGPAAAPLMRLKREYRFQFLFKAQNRKTLNQVLREARQFALDEEWPATALVIDVDPVSLI